MQKAESRSTILWQYFLFTYAVTLVNTFSFLKEIRYAGPLTFFFVAAAYLSYTLFYLLPALVMILIVNRLLDWRLFDRFFKDAPASRRWIVYGFAIFLFALVQTFLFADAFIYRLYGFHLNGFVWNLLFTRGGIESLESGRSTMLTVALIVIAIVAIQSFLLVLLLTLKRIRETVQTLFSRRLVASLGVLLLLLAAGNAVTYGISHLKGYTPVMAASRAFPLYVPLKIRTLGASLGLEAVRDPSFKIDIDSAALHYPLRPIHQAKDHPPLNLVWLVSESLRADMLDPEIMPATWNFSKKAARFENHYSGGNGTRMGLFSMFYGLYGSYWFPFLEERQGPVIVDLLMKNGYQMNMFTSATFTYPEFDKTLFARIPDQNLHEAKPAPGWQADRENISNLLEFLDRRDPSKPFMTFMFFESPHSRYLFPKESVIREPYLEEMNYATMDLQKDMGLIKNRYINAVHHLDSQIARVLEYLERHALLDSTIVLITGDHGEEFMEKGRWGHNSEFTEEQIRVPLVIWAPGRPAAEIKRMSSHLDIPATLLPLLGVTNPPEEYSLGHDLFGKTGRDFTVIASWNDVAYVGHDYKAVFPLNVSGIAQQRVTTRDDAAVENPSLFYENNKPRLLQVFKELRKFNRQEKAPQAKL